MVNTLEKLDKNNELPIKITIREFIENHSSESKKTFSEMLETCV